MSIRAIAQSIQAGEILLGVAVGAESMSLKYVVILWRLEQGEVTAIIAHDPRQRL